MTPTQREMLRRLAASERGTLHSATMRAGMIRTGTKIRALLDQHYIAHVKQPGNNEVFYRITEKGRDAISA